jgi:hypothetical protein
MGTLSLVLETTFAILAAKTIAGALIGVASAGSAGGITEQHVQQGAQVVGGAARTAVTGGLGAVTATGGTALAYGAALRQGATHSYAASYALSRSRTLANVGAFAKAMGAVSPDSDVLQGLYSGSVIGRGEPLSLRSQKALGRDTSQHREQREQQDQALGTLVTVSLIRARHQQRQQAAADAQEARFTESVAQNAARRQAAPPTAPMSQAVEAPIPPAPAQPPLVVRPPQLLAPMPRLMQPTDATRAIATTTADLGAHVQARQSSPATSAPVDGPGYLAALQAHVEADTQPRRPFWEARAERVRVAGEPRVDSAPAQEPLPPQVVMERVTQHATAPGTVITPERYTRTVTPEPANARIAAATAALHTQYQAQRTTSDTPPTEQHTVTRPRRRGPNLTQTPKERR